MTNPGAWVRRARVHARLGGPQPPTKTTSPSRNKRAALTVISSEGVSFASAKAESSGDGSGAGGRGSTGAERILHQQRQAALQHLEGIVAAAELEVVVDHLGRQAIVLEHLPRLVDRLLGHEILELDDAEPFGLDVGSEDLVGAHDDRPPIVYRLDEGVAETLDG